MRTTIPVSVEIRERLHRLRDSEGMKSVNEVLESYIPDPDHRSDLVVLSYKRRKKGKADAQGNR